MSATIYDSKPLVAQMTAELQSEAAQFRKHRHRPARLAQIVVGHDAAAEVYSRQLVRACRTIGLGCVTLAYPFETEEEGAQRRRQHRWCRAPLTTALTHPAAGSNRGFASREGR